jgi:two-component system, NarL family, nitrate/nitrite response regulator NarL
MTVSPGTGVRIAPARGNVVTHPGIREVRGDFVKIVIVASDESATGALRGMLARVDSTCQVEVARHDSMRHSSPNSGNADQPDLVLIDVDSDSSDTVAMIGTCLQRYPRARLVALGSRMDDAYVEAVLKAGALGYLPKSYSETIATGMLRLVLSDASDRPSLPDEKEAAVVATNGGNASTTANKGSTDGFRLTGRQVEVLSLVAQGKTNQVIAKHLGISEGTTKLHMTAIFKALNVQNRAEAMLLASRMQRVNLSQIKEIEGGALDLDWLLPHMSHRRALRDATLFRKGDPGAEFCYLQRGTIRLEEIKVDINSGSVFGEIGLFSPSHERTCTAVCATDVDLFTLTSDQVKRLYLLNPQFALFLVHLIAKRLMADQTRVI